MILKKNTLTADIFSYLRKSVGWNDFPQNQIVKALETDYFDIVAYENQKAIGMARVIGDGIYLALVDVAVHPDMWHQGIGSAMIKEVIKEIQSTLKAEERCSLQLISAMGKETFYEQFGFVKIPDDLSGHGMQLRLMYKKR